MATHATIARRWRSTGRWMCIGVIDMAQTNDEETSFEKEVIIKKTDNWETPKWFKKLTDKFVDMVPTNPTVDCLREEWTGLACPYYLNPPYSNPLPYVLKAVEQHQRHHITVVLLLKLDPSTRWYRSLAEAGAHFLFFGERLHYSESKQSPNFPSVLAILSD